MNFTRKMLDSARAAFQPGADRAGSKVWVRNGISAVLVLALVAMLGYQVFKSWNDVKSYPWKFDYRFLLFAFAVYSINLLTTARVWASIIMRLAPSQQGLPLTHIRLYSITNLVNRLPTPIPYVMARTEAYSARGVGRATTLTAMALEVAVTMISGFLAVLVLLPYGYSVGSKISTLEIVAVSFLFLVVAVVILQPKYFLLVLNKIFQRWKAQPVNVDLGAKETLKWTFSFLPIWAMNGLMCFFLANSIYPVEWARLLMFIQVFALAGLIGWISNFLFFIPNLALRQIAIAFLLSSIVPVPVSVAIVVFNRFAVMLFEIVWVVFFAFILPKMVRMD